MGSITLDADNCIVKANYTTTTVKANIGQNTLKYNPTTNSVEPTYNSNAVSAGITNTSLALGGFTTIIKETGSAVNYEYLTEVSGQYIYHGKAVVGSATSGAVWRIYRIDTSVQPDHLTEKADGDNFTQIWDNRASLTYS